MWLSTGLVDIRFFFGYHSNMAPILPKKKKEILEYLKTTIEAQGFAPTLSEIAKHFNVSSLATIHEHLEFLEKRGFIKRFANGSRSIEIIDQTNEKELASAEILLPLIGVIAAGSPIEAIEDKSEKISVPAEIAAKQPSYVLKVRGDSMIDNYIADGDFVIVKQTDRANNGDTVVALLDDGTATLKEFYKEQGRIRLQPANQNYKPIILDNVTIQGKVVGVFRSY